MLAFILIVLMSSQVLAHELANYTPFNFSLLILYVFHQILINIRIASLSFISEIMETSNVKEANDVDRFHGNKDGPSGMLSHGHTRSTMSGHGLLGHSVPGDIIFGLSIPIVLAKQDQACL